jgi:hypothetical protein
MAHAPEGTINRYYDPATGQFVSVDPMVNETNQPYAYAGDDPVNGVDPAGLCNTPGVIGYYPGPCATTGQQAIAAEQYIQSNAAFSSGDGFSITKGFDALESAAESAVKNPGTALEVVAAGVCIVASAGTCAGFVVLATGVELLQQGGQGDLTATNAAGTLLLGATDLLSAGITGLVDKIAIGTTDGFTETLLYKIVTYTLRTLSVSPSIVFTLSTANQAAASTNRQCR